MTTKTDAPAPPGNPPSASVKKPRFALFVATAAGLGYAPKAPGTFGSLAGLVLALSPMWLYILVGRLYMLAHGLDSVFVKLRYRFFDPILVVQIVITATVALLGVWAATRAARYWGLKDPQRVVIDEVSGQHITLLIGCTLPTLFHAQAQQPEGAIGWMSWHAPLRWKYLLLGFILFRLFDIWKPSPARQAESLPGGWGIMADDWIAGIYAAIGLWLVRSAGL
jgi:phosphatidylglycerophosphatase A